MTAWARPGVKCVCVHDGGACDALTGKLTEWDADKNRVYTIVSVMAVNDHAYLGLWGMPLGIFYDVDAFRPLKPVSMEADMELFAPLLDAAEVSA